MPKFTIGTAKALHEIPPPNPPQGRRGQFDPVFEQLLDLKKETALPITFEKYEDALSARSALRKIAKKRGEFLSSAWIDEKKLGFYFWVEPKETVQEISSGKKQKAA